MAAIVCDQLSKKYGEKTAVDHLSVTVMSGECFGLLGVNGAGKSTTVKMLTGLVKPSFGTARILGFDISEPERYRHLIGLSPQETAVASKLTVRENLDMMARLYCGREMAQQRVQRMVDEFSLEKVINCRAAKLSGGYQRRLSIAMSLIADPKLLFLDEPTLGLDVLARHQLWQVIESLKGKMTVVLTTHYLEEAERLCDRVAIMRNGTLICVGTPAELVEKTGAENFESAFVSLVGGDSE